MGPAVSNPFHRPRLRLTYHPEDDALEIEARQTLALR
jgi:hypothetical protein